MSDESKPQLQDTQKGTYHVSVTIRNPQDGSNADTLKIAYWPGTKAGSAPPSHWQAAFDYALKTVEAAKGLPCDGVCEIRITTFEQGSDEDYLTSVNDDRHECCNPECEYWD